ISRFGRRSTWPALDRWPIARRVLRHASGTADGVARDGRLGLTADAPEGARGAEVIVLGGDRKQYQVLVDADALTEFGITLGQIDQALRENNVNASGGSTVEGPIERPVRVIGRLGPLPAKVIDDLRKMPIKTNSQRNVLLEQVARIEVGPAVKRGDA